MCLCILAPFPSPANSATDRDRGKVVLVVIDGISLADLNSGALPELKKMMSQGATGLMNTRVIGRGRDAAYLTLGAGERGSASDNGKVAPRSSLAFGVDEQISGFPVRDVFRARTGRDVSADAVVHMFGTVLAQENVTGQRGAIPGLLGGTLVRSGLQVGVIGNADVPEAPSRAAMLIGMDEFGRVSYGDVGPRTYRSAPDRLGQKRTDFVYVQSRVDDFLSQVDLLIIESGDTRRINAEASLVEPQLFAAERSGAMTRIDRLIGTLLIRLDRSRDRLLVVSPSPPSDAQNHETLTPLIIWGSAITPGVASSPSTRRPGIVTNMDVAPTILDSLNVEIPLGMVGRPVESVREPDPLGFLSKRQASIYSIESVRRPVIVTYVTISIVALLFSLAVVLLALKGRPARIAQTALLWTVCVPLALLLSVYLQPLPPAANFLAPLLISGLVMLIARLIGQNAIRALAIIGAATGIAIVLDTMTGAHLNAGSVLGYSMVAGSRYYGVGNEYMGVLLGAIIIGIGAMADEIRGKFAMTVIMLFLAAVLAVMALPFLGANVGGTIAVAGGFAYLAIRLTSPKFGFREVLMLCGVIAFALLLLFAVDSGSSSKSHAAKVVSNIAGGGNDAFMKIASRKIAMNYKLLRVTVWTEILVVGLLSLGALFYFRREELKNSISQHPRFTLSLTALAIGMALAFVFNDSGVIAAAAAAVFGLGAIFCHLLAPLASSETRA